MRILHVITTIDRGGAEKQLLILVGEQVARGHTVDVHYLKGKGELKKDFAKMNVRTSGSSFTIFSFAWYFLLILRGYRYTIIHAHLPAAEILSAVFHRKIPLVVSRHNTQMFLDNHPWFSRLLAKYVESQAKLCIAISEAVKAFLLLNLEWKNPATLRVIHYAYGSGTSKQSPMLRSENGIRFLFVGRLTPQKDLETLIKAFSLISNVNEGDSLTIVGDGELRLKLQQLASELGINSRITWIGKVDNVEIFYREHDVLVLPSKYEGFGLVLLEAMTSRVPILAANNSAIPEVLGNNHPGLFTTGNSDELARLLRNAHQPQFLDDCKNMQDERLNNFRPETMFFAIDAAYLDAIS